MRLPCPMPGRPMRAETVPVEECSNVRSSLAPGRPAALSVLPTPAPAGLRRVDGVPIRRHRRSPVRIGATSPAGWEARVGGLTGGVGGGGPVSVRDVVLVGGLVAPSSNHAPPPPSSPAQRRPKQPVRRRPVLLPAADAPAPVGSRRRATPEIQSGRRDVDRTEDAAPTFRRPRPEPTEPTAPPLPFPHAPGPRGRFVFKRSPRAVPCRTRGTQRAAVSPSLAGAAGRVGSSPGTLPDPTSGSLPLRAPSRRPALARDPPLALLAGGRGAATPVAVRDRTERAPADESRPAGETRIIDQTIAIEGCRRDGNVVPIELAPAAPWAGDAPSWTG